MDGDLFSSQLLPGERVQWSGGPVQGWLFTARDFYLVPFSLLWCGIIISVVLTSFAAPASATSAGLVFMLIPMGMLCFGLVFMLGRFPIDAWLRARTGYAVTNQRILIARAAPFGTFTAVGLDRLPAVKFTQRGDGRGTLRFGEGTSMFSNGGFSVWLPSLDPTPQFLAVDNAKSVFDLIQRLSHSQG